MAREMAVLNRFSLRANRLHRIVVMAGFLVLLACVHAVPVRAMSDRNASAAYLSDAKEYIAQGRTNEAIVQLKNALQSDPNNFEARLALGRISGPMEALPENTTSTGIYRLEYRTACGPRCQPLMIRSI